MSRGSGAVAVIRMTSWPVMMVILGVLLLGLMGLWLNTAFAAAGPQGASPQHAVVESRLP